MRNFIFLITILFFSAQCTSAQVVTTIPQYPNVNDYVTIIFNAKDGNGALAGYTGIVFAHTGVITSQSTSGTDWKNVVDNWATYDSSTQMASLGNDLYSISFNIRNFYKLDSDAQVIDLAFVFRNEDGSIVGRNANGSDILYAINVAPLGNFISYENNNGIITVHGQTNSVSLQPYDDHLVKISLLPTGIVNPDTSFSVVMQPQALAFQITEDSGELILQLAALQIVIKKFPIQFLFIKNNDTLLQDELGLYSDGEASGVNFSIKKQNEHFYGTGSRAIDVDRRGQILNSYNTAQYGYSNGATPLNINIPFITSSRLYGLYFDNYSPGNWDIGATDPSVLKYTAASGVFTYFFTYGDSLAQLLDEYTQLTGRPKMPPRWAMGYIQSRFGYQSETEVQGVVTQMQSSHFPLDAIVLDLYWFGQPSMMGNLTWDNSTFPTPVTMMHNWDSTGVKTICIAETYFTTGDNNFSFADQNHFFATNSGGTSYIINDFWAGSAGLLDMFRNDAQQWMWSFYKQRTDEGVGGWWSDSGEPENHPSDLMHINGPAETVHNAYNLVWAQMLSRNFQQVYPGVRLFNLCRSGFAGMQHYCCFPWSGDVQRSWSGLQAQIPIFLGMGMCGEGFMNSDIGGFTGGGENDELYTRWQEFGSFCPIMRAHGSGAPTEPIYYPASTQTIVRSFIQLRHELFPYNYTLVYENALHGTPLVRPLNFYEPQNEAIANINDEYLWGRNFLVAPVLDAGQTSRSVIFPSGTWINYWTNETYAGNKSYTISAPLNQLPLFVHAGSFITKAPLVSSLKFYHPDTLSIAYYSDQNVNASSDSVYEDDGNDPLALSDGKNDLLKFSASQNGKNIHVLISHSGSGYPGEPTKRNFQFSFPRIGELQVAVLWNSIPLEIVSSQAAYYTTDSAAWYDAANQVLYAHVNWNDLNAELDILFQPEGITGAPVNSMQIGKPFPDPFTEEVNVPLYVSKAGNYVLSVFSTDGKLISAFLLNNLQSGNHVQKIQFNSFHQKNEELIIVLKNKQESAAVKVIYSR